MAFCLQRPMFCFTLIAGSALLASMAGCEGLKDPVPEDPVLTAKSEPVEDLAPKKAKFPELPKGAGSMDSDAPEELTPTSTGVYYRMLRKGEGKKPNMDSVVIINYRGWLDNGKEFDSTYAKGAPAKYPLGNLIHGWIQGMQLVEEGGMIELEIPPKMAYGASERPGIPANSTLHFLIELIEVE